MSIHKFVRGTKKIFNKTHLLELKMWKEFDRQKFSIIIYLDIQEFEKGALLLDPWVGPQNNLFHANYFL